MVLKKTAFKKKQLKTKYSKVGRRIKKKWKINFLKIILYFIFLLALFSFLLTLILYKKYIVDLPSVKELENLDISQSSTIYDRDWNELYKIFKENRTYIPYEKINPKMVNALIAGEDKRFWDNPGFDIIGLSRAVLYKIIGKNDGVVWTSTLTQQLIRNTIISNERSIERKIKELYLSYKLTNGVSKEKILELYLNKIAFWSNSYGIEQAAQTFFGVPASDLGILESSILASIPKWPTYYSPYNHYDRVVGYSYIYDKDDSENITKIITPSSHAQNAASVQLFKTFLENLKAKELSESKVLICWLVADNFKANIDVDNEGCSVLDYSDLLMFLNSVQLKQDNQYLEYQTGRKDFILGRMLEDNYISFDEYRSALLKWLWFEFTQSRTDIKYPHFVFYVKQYLEDKYGADVLESGWFKVFTTLDPNLQDKAEEIVQNQAAINQARFGGQNAAMISLDNQAGEILAMVGWKDYFDTEIWGNNNMMTAALQPWSTFKPFVYSLALKNEKIGTKTPVYDVQTTFPGSYTPSNFDGKFMGKMTIAKALNYSRNVPAIKMFYLAWRENAILKFMRELWVESLDTFQASYLEKYGKSYSYGAPLALWTGEMTWLELAQAYSVFANMGELKEFTPILKIIDSNGVIIEEKQESSQKNNVMWADQAYLMNNILSDTSSRPSAWNNFLSLPDRTMAAKTGTSTKQYTIGSKKYIFARNLWTIAYTPQITTVAWAGNTDGSQLWARWNGLEWAGSIVHAFMRYAHQGKPAQSWKSPVGVKSLSISSLSWLLPSDTTLAWFLTSALFINSPITYDNSFRPLEVDALCNWVVTAATPPAAIRTISLLQLQSLNPQNSAWEQPVQKWVAENAQNPEIFPFQNSWKIAFSSNPEACDHSGQSSSSILVASTLDNNSTFQHGNNYIELGYQSNNPIISLDILIDNTKIWEIPLQNKTKWSYRGNILIPNTYEAWNYKLSFRIVDNIYWDAVETNNITIKEKDTTPPNLVLKGPSTLSLLTDQSYIIEWTIDERAWINAINVLLNGEIFAASIQNNSRPRNLNFELNKDGNIPVWEHIVTIQVIDSSFNTGSQDITLSIQEES